MNVNVPEGLKNFIEFLAVKKLAKGSLIQYSAYYKLLEKEIEERGDIDQTLINQFLLKHPSTVSRGFLSNFLSYLEEQGVDLKLKRPRITGRKPRIKRKELTDDRANIIRKWIYTNKPYIYVILFDLAYNCGLRRQETIQIKINDFDWETWGKDKTRGCQLKITGKGSKDRLVLVPSKVMQYLAKYIKTNPKYTIESPLFSNKSFFNWHDIFHKAIKETMDYPYVLHDLRRSRATQWHRGGIEITQIRDRLGHEEIQTTSKYINPGLEEGLKQWEEEVSEK